MTEPALTEKFRPDPSAVPEVRRFLRKALSALAEVDHEQELADALLMAGNELATNAVLHARTEFTVRVRDDGTVVRIEVSDRNTKVPRPCLARPTPPPAAGLRSSTAADWRGRRAPHRRQDGVDPGIPLSDPDRPQADGAPGRLLP